MIPRVLSIAGSDPDGGAGIQADLKTFSALGVYGMTVITSVTAQNTIELKKIHDLPINMIKAQIDALVSDIGIDVVKTGMLHKKEIIEVVSDEIRKQNFPLVIDPVMATKSGATLLELDAKSALIKFLFPLATIVTPNSIEAETISGIKIKTMDDAKEAAKKISELGPKAVVIKGGHAFSDKKALDLLYFDGDFKIFEENRISTKTTHGAGCCFASAIAAELAKGKSIVDAVKHAKDFITKAIRFGFNIGHGCGPVNPMAHLYNEAEKYQVIENIKEAVAILESHQEFSELIPESQTNVAMALPLADSIIDVAAIPGRIVRIGKSAKASSCPEFGASSHIARTVLTVMKYDSSIRAGMNIKYSERLIEACKEQGLIVSFYDRKKEPPETKEIEGMSMIWGAEQAVKKIGKVPDIIYHKGDWGKEPMITLLGKNAVEVVKMAVKIAKLQL
ncbi:MAG: bifunctional hydroxymethylpyrimidine kinase/phosphomethylpyrimidine kinase [archaeon]|nr:bifunctional hydroxymethylpyrimidine kinase/phosphomethylpyrimidine kinase [archaeon]MCP8314092.1 bifunctional hydroxymethylpyrimidine kinase/phosphomethylpyrimidine kinase [archaeon]MCP8317939.1 bifunctional hydroxymethylpyrimidine kinase/phosphomethylpyrimidine kinase [archaeon]MCP8319743.1 bifunctional hydroxymethylpyrimidine kinase/phosphomethylpyrimidine kinase [archaeon]